MLWWRGIVASNNNLNLREEFSSFSFVWGDEVKGTASLSVESHNLCERLGNNHFKSFVQEVSQSNSILVEVSRDKALVSSVEERIEIVLLADSGNHFPLFQSWINTSWVVSASVEEDARSWGSVLEILDHSLEVKSLGLLVEVSVLSDFESGSFEYLIVVAPSWITDIDGSWSELDESISDDSESSSSRESLAGHNSSAVNIWVVPSEENSS